MGYKSSESEYCILSTLFEVTLPLFMSFLNFQITYHFAQLGVPIPDARHGDSSIMHGLTAALESLTECSDAQLEKMKSPENKSKVKN